MRSCIGAGAANDMNGSARAETEPAYVRALRLVLDLRQSEHLLIEARAGVAVAHKQRDVIKMQSDGLHARLQDCVGGRYSRYITDRRIARSASSMAAGVPTCSHCPSSRWPNSRPRSAAEKKNGASRNTSSFTPAKSCGLMMPTPA